jgi:hypothetical protein
MPPQRAHSARASRWGNPGAPGIPTVTSSSPPRERIATPFHCASPWRATAQPRAASSPASSSSNAALASLVSCRQTTSGWRSSSHGSRRGSRCLAELTFQVATRAGHSLATVCGGGSGYEQPKAKLRCIESDEVAVAFGPPA